MGLLLVVAITACGGDVAATTAPAGDTIAESGTTEASVEETTTTVAAGVTTLADVTAEDPCALATPEQVAAAFGATTASGEAGIARNCSYTLDGGITPTVEVFHFGASSGWDGVKAGYEENRGGVTAVAGVGEEAYNPNDAGPYELVVRSGDVIFAVAVQTGGGGPQVEAAIVDLAGAIAGG
jgi:hypothetical protein